MNTLTHALPSEWIDAAKFEVLYSLSRRTFWLWISEGKLTAYRPCRRRTLVRRSDVERLLEASKAGVSLDAIVGAVMADLGTDK